MRFDIPDVSLRRMMSSHAAVEVFCGILMLIAKPNWLYKSPFGNDESSQAATTLLMRWLGCTIVASGVLGYSTKEAIPSSSTDAVLYGITLYHALITGIALAHRSEFEDFFVTLIIPSLHGFLTIGFALAAATGGSRSARVDRQESDLLNDTVASFVLSSSSASSFHNYESAVGGFNHSGTNVIQRSRSASAPQRLSTRPKRRSSTPTADTSPAALIPVENDIECGVTTTLQSVPVSFDKDASYCSSFDGGKLVSCVSSDAMQSPNSFESVQVLSSRFPSDFCTSELSTSLPKPSDNWELSHSDIKNLSSGDTIFMFTCKTGSRLTQFERSALSVFINMVSRGNHESCDKVNMHIDNDVHACTFFIIRAVYVLPAVSLSDITIRLLSSVAYHTACQPGKSKVWSDCLSFGDYDTFRITKPIVPVIFSMTIQFKCSLVPESLLEELSTLTDGIPVHKAVLMERTKRNNKPDMTKSCKSLLCYHQLPDNRGVIVFNVTGIANSTVPGILASIIDRLGSVGSKEAAETAAKTRSYLSTLSKK